MLQEEAGVGLNGAILISPAFEFGGLDMNDYGVVQWVDVLPTMAGAAAHHGRGRALPEGTPLAKVRRAAEDFAAGDYATFLIRGAALSAAERERILTRLADFLGLPVELVTRAEGRVRQDVFVRELLRDERKVLGFYDATITTTDPFPDRTGHEAPDATLAGISAAYTAAINKQLRSEIGVESDRDYRLISFEVNQAWKEDSKKHFFQPPDGATDSFRYGMALNPHMRAFITHGKFDMVTPYFASDRFRNLMRLDADTAARLTVQHFDGGHMFYAWEESRHAFTAAISKFYKRALAG
jgi:carboxypeptidase C (cathepsin A)